MSLKDTVNKYVRAAFTGIWIKSHEHDDAIQELVDMCKDRERGDWTVCWWDLHRGLQGPDVIVQQNRVQEGKGFLKPQALFDQLSEIAEEFGNHWYEEHGLRTDAAKESSGGTVTLLVLKNFHRPELIDNSKYLQTFANMIAEGQQATHRYYIVFLSPVVNVPTELEKQVVVVDHSLPTKDQLWRIAESTVEPEELPADDAKHVLLEAAAGLTRFEAEGAFSLSVIETRDPETRLGRLDSDIVWGVKAQSLKKRNLLELYEGDASFDQMGGVEYIRDFCTKLVSNHGDNPLLYPKGVMLLGVPGSGKTQFVRCFGNATGRRVLQMRLGLLRSKFQGESDERMDAALGIVDAMSPCILFIDEVEKGLSGVGSGGKTDGGTGERMFSRLLEWQNDHTTDVIFLCTCNDISRIMNTNPEFARAERFDAMFFFDMPSPAERRQIWEIYLNLYGLNEQQYGDKLSLDELVKLSKKWTGAEIKTAVRQSAMLKESFRDVVPNLTPVATMADSRLSELRDWASGRCRSTSKSGLFIARETPGSEEGRTRRKPKRRRNVDRN